MNKDLEIIKKKYGENMAHLCRQLFPTILEHEGDLPNILQDNFALSRNLYNDIKKNNYENEFQSYLYNRYDNTNIRKVDVNSSPEELMLKAGYKLYKCNTIEQIDFFKKYYAEGEQLCTFNDNTRLERSHVFFAVKDNVDKLNRKDFTSPSRQDEYGTSVISIQFSKGESNITSIKNRYNTAVDNPDATFSNNLDNIVKGLTSSFEKYYNLDINSTISYFGLSDYKKASDKRYYKYFHKIDDTYYCENNIIIDNDQVIRDYQVPERYIIMDNYILDLTKKKVSLYNSTKEDGFINDLNFLSKIDVIRNKETGNKSIKFIKDNQEEVDIILNKNNKIISYKNDNLIDAGDNFLRYSTDLENFEAKNLRRIGTNFLEHNRKLHEFNQPLLEVIPNDVLSYNENITTVNIPSVKSIGNNFLNENRIITKLNLEKVEEIKDGFLEWNRNIEEISIPNIKRIGNNFLHLSDKAKLNENSKVLSFENLEEIGENFLSSNETIEEINLPKVKKVGGGFLTRNLITNKVNMENVEDIKDAFLSSNRDLEELSLPNVKNIGGEFLSSNERLKKINIENVETIKDRFLKSNKELTSLEANNLKYVGREFMPLNSKAKLHLSNLNMKDKIYNEHIRKLKIRSEEFKHSLNNIGHVMTKLHLLKNHHTGQILSSNINNNYSYDTAKSLVDELSSSKKEISKNNEKR